mmetsp:Transcript_21739/g.18740  ORF Transcript_21739/g.18740 Transcript_21739/m.18740 type:complete len:91 (-) Transcript_21739:163-435(-)
MWIITKDAYREIDHIFDECIFGLCDCVYCQGLLDDPGDWLLWYASAPIQMKNYDKYVRKLNKVLGGQMKGSIRGGLIHLEHEHPLDWVKI